MSITAASVTLNGTTTALTYNSSTGFYEATITAPGTTSWNLDGHVYAGTVSATNRDDLGVVTTVTEETSLRVLETTPPSLTVLTPEDYEVTTTDGNTFRWIAYDADSGIDPETAALMIDGAAASGVTYTAGDRYWFFSWAGTLEAGAHTLVFSVSDNDGNTATPVSLNYAVIFFITDRTQADVDRAAYLQSVIRANAATAAEITEWNGNSKGIYNTSDMNRVGLALWFIQRWAARYGYDLNLSARRNWTESIDGPTRTEGATYLADTAQVRETLPMLQTTPDAPESVRFLGYQGANDIEQILKDACFMLPRAALSFWYSGEIATGET